MTPEPSEFCDPLARHAERRVVAEEAAEERVVEAAATGALTMRRE